MKENETIAAVATANGKAALAIIRISGKNAYKVFEKSILEKEKNIKPRNAKNFTIIDENKKPIDEIIAIKYKEPKSFTGEDLVEIIAHGGIYNVKKIMGIILKNGAKIAEKGEFTKRAFINGKIDLMKAEAIKAIIESRSENDHTIAIQNYYEKNMQLKEIENKIKNEISIIEAEIEFGETDYLEQKTVHCNTLNIIIREIEAEIKRNEKFKKNANGIEITIAGPTNAGKSSLFNTILGYKRSIVSEIRGTTRDKVSEKIEINGVEINLNDTAGIRKTEEEIENEGIKITEETIENASIIIWVTDAGKTIEDVEKKVFEKIQDKDPIIVINKIDIKKNEEKIKYYKKDNQKVFEISVKKKINLEVLYNKIIEEIIKKNENEKKPTLFLNERQKDVAIRILKCLKEAKKNWSRKEIAAFYLKKIISEIEKNTGKIRDEEIIDKIFKSFCIGK